eukprot:scaffold197912_cov33-Cyclotella_meneghiniana.AAC.1
MSRLRLQKYRQPLGCRQHSCSARPSIAASAPGRLLLRLLCGARFDCRLGSGCESPPTARF